MVAYENQCVDCGLPCLGSTCIYRNVRVLYCDGCGDEADKLYLLDDGGEYCKTCVLERLEVVE